MNQKTAAAWALFDELPPDAQQEVLDFIVFLRTRRAASVTRRATKRIKLADDPFIGLWRDRKEMSDISGWVRQVREREWASYRE